MNVFIILVIFILIAGFYFMTAPNQNIARHTTEYAIEQTAVNSVLTCMAHVHAQAVRLDAELRIDGRAEIDNTTPCAANYAIETIKVCTDGRRVVANCIPVRAGTTIINYMITIAGVDVNSDLVLRALSDNFLNNFGIGLVVEYGRQMRMITGNGTSREIPEAIVRDIGIGPGAIIYITQYSVAARPEIVRATPPEQVRCGPRELRVFRQNRWQCVAQNNVMVCADGTVFDWDSQSCITDESRRPLCAPHQSAVVIDGRWRCVNPVQHTTCPTGRTPLLDYSTMTWRCV